MYKKIQRDATIISWFFQDLCMFRVPAVPIIRSTILQLAVIGIAYITLDREIYGNVHFKGCPESAGWSHVTNRPIMDNL
jgi:hypothetical protein